MKDNVLRCAAMVRYEKGEGFFESIVDAIDVGDRVLLVFEWAQIEGFEGETPKRTLSVPKEEFKIKGPRQGFELLLLTPIDLPALRFVDRQVSKFELRSEGDIFSYPRPDDQESR